MSEQGHRPVTGPGSAVGQGQRQRMKARCLQMHAECAAQPDRGSVVAAAGFPVLAIHGTPPVDQTGTLGLFRCVSEQRSPGTVIATGWLLSAAHNDPARDWPLRLLTVCATVLVWCTKLHLLWMIGAGALAGAIGLV